MSLIQGFVNLTGPFLPRQNLPVVPVGNQLLMFQIAEMLIEFQAKIFVEMRVRDEDFDRSRRRLALIAVVGGIRHYFSLLLILIKTAR